MSENLGVSLEEGKQILEEFFKMFPKIREFTQYNEECAKKIGYVEDYKGRRRHLDDALLPELEITGKKKIVTNADILFGCDRGDCQIEIPDDELTRLWEEKWQEFSNSRRYSAKREFKELAKKNDIDVYDNGAFISKTMTQCTNARIQGCISGDTLVLTKESGISNISSLLNQNVTVWDGREWSDAVVLPSGVKKKCVVTFSNGHQIVCSSEHKFGRVPISDKLEKDLIFTPCSDLKIGDRIRVSEYNFSDVGSYASAQNNSPTHNANNYYLDMISDSFQRGVFLGRLASDGSILNREVGGKSVRFFVAEHEKDVVEKLLAFIPYKHSLHNVLRENRKQRMYYIDIYSKTLVEEIESLHIKSGIDSRIFADTAMLRGFLCGMFDGDGSAKYEHVNLTFGTHQDFTQYLKDIQKALLFFGIRSRLRKYSSKYRVDIYKQDITKFTKRIGFLGDEKRSLSENIKCANDGHIFKDVLIVKSVDYTDEYTEMYDVCNTKRGVFVANGVVTHNSAATLTKKAMVAIANDELMKKYDFHLLIPVHDELLGECKAEYVEEAAQRLTELMINAAKPDCTVGMKCDAYIVKHWYADEVFAQIHDTYSQYVKNGCTKEDAIKKIGEEYPELLIETIKQMCEGTFDVLSENV